MHRIHKDELERCLDVATNGVLVFDWTAGRPRVTNKSGTKYFSPRLTNQEMDNWLSGFMAGTEFQSEK